MSSAASHDDDALFRPSPPRDDCPLCFVRMPPMGGVCYMSCCGKNICDACWRALITDVAALPTCPFCRTAIPTTRAEMIKSLDNRIRAGDAEALSILGGHYSRGDIVPRDVKKAIELLKQAADLGDIGACGHMGDAYNPQFDNGMGVEIASRDWDRSMYYYGLAAMGGHDQARFNLGALEFNRGNIDRSMKHYMLAAALGNDNALGRVKEGYIGGNVTKDEFATALRSHKDSQDEMKHDQRQKVVTEPMRSITPPALLD